MRSMGRMNTPVIESRDQLLAPFIAGCKPPEAWRIGTEHEKIGFCLDTLRPIPYEGERSIRRVLELLASEGWELEYERDCPVALRRGEGSITLEPGGQLELSGAPVATVHDTCQEVRDHLRLLAAVREELHIGFLGLGFQPKWPREDVPWMPKERYAIMRRYMPRVGGHGLDMMLRTATIQVNLDFSSEQDMARKMRVGMCLQPLVTALFAASPFVDGRPGGWLSQRARCWLDTDPARTGAPAMVFDEHFGFERYVDWLLDAPMYFVMREGRFVDCSGQSFRDFLGGRLPALPGERPTPADWELHMTTVFPDVRLKGYMEMRGADAGGKPWICALPALWKGLLYDARALDAAWDMVADWTHEEVTALRRDAARRALGAQFRGTPLWELAARMLEIAADGLTRQDRRNANGQDEHIFLAPLQDAVARRQTQANAWLHAWRTRWNESIDPVFTEAALP